MTSARHPNMTNKTPLPMPLPLSPYPRERSWSSIPLPPYPKVARKGVSSKNDHEDKDEAEDEGKVVRSSHLFFASNTRHTSNSNDSGTLKENENLALVSSSACKGESGDEEWMIISTTPTTLTQEREEEVDGGIDEHLSPNTDGDTTTRFRGYVTGAKIAVMGNVEGVKEMMQKALPALSAVPALPALPIFSTLSTFTTLPTLPTLPKVPALPALPFLKTWRTKAQATRAGKKIQAQVWTDNEKKVAQFEEAIHGMIDSGLKSASTSTSPCVDEGQTERMEIERGLDCAREVEEEEEWKEEEHWDDFIS